MNVLDYVSSNIYKRFQLKLQTKKYPLNEVPAGQALTADKIRMIVIEWLFSYRMNPRGDFYVLRCNEITLFKNPFPHKRCVKNENPFSRKKKKMDFTFYFFSHI